MLAVSGASKRSNRCPPLLSDVFYGIRHLPTDYQLKVQAGSSHVHLVWLHSFKFGSAGFLAHPTWGPPGGGLLSMSMSCPVFRRATSACLAALSGNYGIMNVTLI